MSKTTFGKIPTNKVLPIIQRSDVYSAGLNRLERRASTSGSSSMDAILTNVTAAHSGGIPANQAVLYGMFTKDDGIVTYIDIPDEATATKVKAWLAEKSIYFPTPKSYGDVDHTIGVLLDAGQITPLIQAFSNVKLSAESYKNQGLPMSREYWSQGAKEFESSMVQGFVRPAGVFGAQGSQSTPTPPDAAFVAALAKDTRDRQDIHGAYDWHQRDQKGNNVKVGIIDWGYHGIENITELDDLSFYIHSTVKQKVGNAFCQRVGRSIWPWGRTTEMQSPHCKPLIGARVPGFASPIPVTHGASVAEIIQDMAPDATILYAQANSPRQLYRATYWLQNRDDVDIIVHAGGWPYDGPGDGSFSFPVIDPDGKDPYQKDAPADHTDLDHAKERMFPSPLATIDHFVKGTSGPLWINAAGNQEDLTIFIDDPEKLGGTGDYADYLVLTSGISASDDTDGSLRTCQIVPKIEKTIYAYNLRWADDWSNSTIDLDMWIGETDDDPDDEDSGFARTDTVQQPDDDKPFRRVVSMSVDGHQYETGDDPEDYEHDHCLRIRVNENSMGTKNVPEWVQVQIFGTDYDAPIADDVDGEGASLDGSGHSIVNPASSDNSAVLAVAAKT